MQIGRARESDIHIYVSVSVFVDNVPAPNIEILLPCYRRELLSADAQGSPLYSVVLSNELLDEFDPVRLRISALTSM